MSHVASAIPADTRAKQERASDPARSAWVSANAGSGKTFVLTRRVVRLLLGGTAPGRILCLTFTKAAAANMSIRVFDTLSKWVTLDDAALTAAILDTGAPRPGPEALAAARRLFARTVETPGGLKILTIHAFCEKLLHSFPFEANVAAGFTVIEEQRQSELLGRAREAVLSRAVAEPGTRLGTALATLTEGLSLDTFEALVREVANDRAALAALVDDADALGERLTTALGTGGDSVEAIERAMLEDGLAPSEWEAVGRHLLHVGGNKGTVAEALIAASTAPAPDKLAAYLLVFLTRTDQPRAPSYLPKPLRAAEPALTARLDAEQRRLIGLLGRRRAAAAHARTMALLTVAGAVLERYEILKRRAGLLDFGDLIARSRELLARAGSAWVLFKLDAGIDHILVDEAQDTSPDQWAILQAIGQDFFAGEGAGRPGRTMFAVGDEKQSIYSFQGARPAMMKAVHEEVRRRAAGAGLPFDSVDLLLSFRSAARVLDVVDRVFAHGDNARGLSAGSDKPPPHQALKTKLPGLVEIWPKVAPAPLPDPADWRLPVDVADSSSPAAIVATRVAEAIARMTAPGAPDTVDDGAGRRRPVRAGDVLVLVRARNSFFDAVIRALKERRVPVAGADRLNLTDHIATLDLMAAGRAALLPDDDLTLAAVLKSPLVGLDDDDLIRLAPGRPGSLEAALRASPHPRDRHAAATLAVWRDRATTLTPFAFYTRLLGEDGGRKRLLGRLGPEAGDVIDEFLAHTLAHERDGAPSLLAFLARLEGTELSIKRDLAAAGDAVRVMTVHAAKGLEAKIVFLPDTCAAPRRGQHEAKLFRLEEREDDVPVLAWSPRADTDTDAIAARRTAGFEAALDEHRRLLYVALTRAEERLYIAGFHGKTAPPPECWYDMIVAADLGERTAVPAFWNPAEESVLRFADPVPPGEAQPTRAEGEPPAMGAAPAPPPAWLARPARLEVPLPPPIRPSNALGAADHPDRLEGDQAEAIPIGPRRVAALAGRLTHRLLQHLPALPPARRRDAGLRFVARHGRQLDAAAREGAVAAALAVLDMPSLAPLFGPGSRAEVAIAAIVARPDGSTLAVTGQIDRLCVTGDAVLIAEFKSGRPRPLADTPPSYLAQLALYHAAVAPLYPGKPVTAALIWTAGPAVIAVDGATLATALATVPTAGG